MNSVINVTLFSKKIMIHKYHIPKIALYDNVFCCFSYVLQYLFCIITDLNNYLKMVLFNIQVPY